MGEVLRQDVAGAPVDSISPLSLRELPGRSVPVCGLTSVTVEVSGSVEPKTYQFEVWLDGTAAPIFSNKVDIDGPPARIRLGIHTHLLPDGAVRLHAKLRDVVSGCEWWKGFDFNVANPGKLAAQVRASLTRSRTPVVFVGPCDSSRYDYADPSLVPWFDRADAFKEISRLQTARNLNDWEVDALKHFVNEGYIVIENCVEPALLEQIRGEMDDAISNSVNGAAWGSSKRIEQLHRVYPGIRRLWMYPAVIRILEILFGESPRPCQTLTYFFGSQQDAHQDTIHLTPFPAGYMCGVWVAIDDVQADSGELEIFPGSHRLPRIRMNETGCEKVKDDWSQFGEIVVKRWKEMLQLSGAEGVYYRPKAGTVLIWHENLMHGGSIRRDQSLSRRSIVSHFFAEGAIGYYDSTGAVGTMEAVAT